MSLRRVLSLTSKVSPQPYPLKGNTEVQFVLGEMGLVSKRHIAFVLNEVSGGISCYDRLMNDYWL